MKKNIIVIPVYNDWKSLNKLLLEINKIVKNISTLEILIINDCSTDEIYIDKKKLHKIKEIKVLSLNQNLGSQKDICVGLDYLRKKKDNFYITIMDGDGEDDPFEIDRMFEVAQKNPEHVVTSCRKGRNESFLIQFCYRLHLIISFILTWNWISFGNFSCFNSNNLKKISLNNIWYAYSSGILKSCKIKKLYAMRQKRYFESSKVNFLKLVEHSLRVIGVSFNRIIVSSLAILFIIFIFPTFLNYLFYSIILFINLLVFFVIRKNSPPEQISYVNYVKDSKNI